MTIARRGSGSTPISLVPPERKPLEPQADVSAAALAILAALALIAAAYLARGLLIPIVLAVLISYALEPAIAMLARHHVPRAFGAALVLALLSGGLGWTVYELRDEAVQTINELPETVRKFRQFIRDARATDGPVSRLKQAAEELERAAVTAAGGTQKLPGATSVQIVEPALKVRDYLVWGPMSAAAIAGQISLMVFLVYFLLASGDLFKRKLVKLAGASLERRRVTVNVLDEISNKIAYFLLHLVIANTVVAVATGLAFWWIGMAHPAIWGIAAGVLNTVPYFGPILVMVGSAAAGFIQTGSAGLALMAGGVSLAITSLEGYLLTPYLMGHATRMNAVAVFLGVLFWGWLWGIWGALLAVPLLVMLKTVANHVEDLKPIGELLGD